MLRRHTLTVHENLDMRARCELCGKVLFNKDSLKRHVRTKHLKDKRRESTENKENIEPAAIAPEPAEVQQQEEPVMYPPPDAADFQIIKSELLEVAQEVEIESTNQVELAVSAEDPPAAAAAAVDIAPSVQVEPAPIPCGKPGQIQL